MQATRLPCLSSIVKKVYEDLKQYGEVQRGLMGVNITDVTSEIAKEENLKEIKGVILTGLMPDGAAKAGRPGGEGCNHCRQR